MDSGSRTAGLEHCHRCDVSGPLSRRGLLGLAAGMAGCGARLHDFPFHGSTTLSAPLGLSVRFASVCCAVVEGFGTAVLCDPFFTHLPLRQVAVGRTVSDPAAVAPFVSHLNAVEAVIVGHSHYDHAMAVPTVDPHLASEAVFLGSETLAHTFAASSLRHPVVALNDQLTTMDRIGQPWLHPGGRLRIWPILSGHPTQWAFFHLYRRQLQAPRSRPPVRAHHYQEGVTLAFLVDFLEAGAVVARVYVESSSRGRPDGFFPPALLEERGVDLALVSMDVANREMRSGDSVLHLLQPRHVVFTHYEDFFRGKDEPPREIVKVNLPQTRTFFQNTPERSYWIPGWNTRLDL